MKSWWPCRGLVAATWLALAVAAPLAQAQPLSLEAQSRALSRASDAVIGVQVQAVDDARSAATLGRLREGSGVVISADGLVLTIGYLVLEAERVELVTDDARRIPARVVAYDLATGFGLVQALAPVEHQPVPLGEPAAVGSDEPLVVASGGEDAAVSVARLVSRRPFAGYWEYHIDGALFTHPPRRDHSGAGLFNGRGELLGVGSLVVANAAVEGVAPLPGNMFVPVDLLRPILPELLQRGASRARRAPGWGSTASNRAGRCAWRASTTTARPTSPAFSAATRCSPSTASRCATWPRCGRRCGPAARPSAPSG